MVDKKQIIETIFGVVDEVNKMLPKDGQLTKSPETILIGRAGRLDSLGIVSFITALEERIEDVFKITITLADERAMDLNNNPFETIEKLVNYIYSLLENKTNESREKTNE